METRQNRILCVEGYADTCLLLNLMLGREAIEVVCVSTVAEGLRLARAQGFDLYLLDGLLGDGSGVDLCAEIRRFDKRTPVVFFSTQAQESHRRQAYEAGAQAYLVKPTDLYLLTKTVVGLLSEAKAPALA